MANRLYIVAVRVIVRARAGGSVVDPACRERCRVEGIELGAGSGGERYVQLAGGRVFLRNPEPPN